MSLWLNHVTIDATGAGSHTADPSNPTAIGTVVDGSGFTPTSGNLLVCIVAGPVTSGTPSGWTLPSGGSAVSTDGLYVFWKTAAGSDTLITGHNSAAYNVMFDFYELDSAASFGTSASFPGAASGANETLSGLTGSNLVMSPVCAPGSASAFTYTGATKTFDAKPSDLQSRYATANVFSAASSVTIAATSATHEQLVFSIAGLTNTQAATATGSLSLSGLADSSLPASATGSMALAGSADTTQAASGSLSFAGTAGVAAQAAASGFLTLSSTGVAVPLYATDTSNAFRGLSIGMTAEVFVTRPATPPPIGTSPEIRVDKAIALPDPVLVKGRPT